MVYFIGGIYQFDEPYLTPNRGGLSVAVTRAGVFANLWNKIGKILKIFEQLDYLRSRCVLCQL
jgi:hypothetical protein